MAGLFSEGPTDRRFLPKIVYRTLLGIVQAEAVVRVELQEDILSYTEKTNAARAAIVCRDRDSVDLFVIHADASRARVEQVEAQIVGQVRTFSRAECAMPEHRIVPLMPVREMEAWTLADPDAVARVFGFASWPDRVPLSWHPERAETVEDPKRALNEAVRVLFGGRKGRRAPDPGGLLDQIAAEMDLRRLGRLPSYQRFETDLRVGLGAIGIVRRTP
ncbi:MULTISPECIES: DUF4276 family protein [Methylobacterium]|uniref:DUF4276 family protein n=1 Tax=Methylobacterium TaxID=407 RepID=UPI0013ECA46F|nr:DUF4276 family protein [Methylobacterium sp. DB0501]NGM32707.1 DUF4276 family protein [Methylobacterium sp. DB0501]